MIKKSPEIKDQDAIEYTHLKGQGEQLNRLLDVYGAIVDLTKFDETNFDISFILHGLESIPKRIFRSVEGTTLVGDEKRVKKLIDFLGNIDKKFSPRNNLTGMLQVHLENEVFELRDNAELNTVLKQIRDRQFNFVKITFGSSQTGVTGFHMYVQLK